MDDSKLFEQSYVGLLPQVKQVDLTTKINILGIHKQSQSYIFDFFNRQIIFDGNDFFDRDGIELTPAIKVILCSYILMCPQKEIESVGKLVTFREFADAGPLFSSFAANTGKIIQTTFSNQLGTLKQQCLKLGGIKLDTNSYDFSVRFRALPKIPIILNFNDVDDIMPATAGFLYHDTAASYLDLKCLTATCTYLTGLLIQHA